MTSVWLDPAVVFLAATLYNVGKAGAHATRYPPPARAWVRKPLIPGLPISDLYHMFSGLEWAAVLPYCWVAWGAGGWWILGLLTWGTVWPASKLLKGLGWREALSEAWYVQIFTAIRRAVR